MLCYQILLSAQLFTIVYLNTDLLITPYRSHNMNDIKVILNQILIKILEIKTNTKQKQLLVDEFLILPNIIHFNQFEIFFS